MKDIKRLKGRYYIASLVAEGEHSTQDFKYAVNDACKIARTVSAFANTDGGRLLIGVKDNGVIAGVRNEEDIYVVEQAAALMCRPPQEVAFTAFACEGGLTVIRAEVFPADHRPVSCRDADGHWHAYVRVADENILAPPLLVGAWALQASSPGGVLGPDDQALHTLLATTGPATVEQAMKALRLSRASTEAAACRLYAARLLRITPSPTPTLTLA